MIPPRCLRVRCQSTARRPPRLLLLRPAASALTAESSAPVRGPPRTRAASSNIASQPSPALACIRLRAVRARHVWPAALLQQLPYPSGVPFTAPRPLLVARPIDGSCTGWRHGHSVRCASSASSPAPPLSSPGRPDAAAAAAAAAAADAASSTASVPPSAADVALLARALAPSAPRPTASPPPLSASDVPSSSAGFSVPFAPMPSPSPSALAAAVPDPLQAFASQQSDQPTVDSTKDPSVPLSIPAMPDLPPSANASAQPQPFCQQPPPPPLPTPSSAPSAAPARLAADSCRPSAAEHFAVVADGDTTPSPSARPDSQPSPSRRERPEPRSVEAASAPTGSDAALNPSPSTASVSSALSSVASAPSVAAVGGGGSGSGSGSGSVVPSFLRPAELSLWSRVKLHPLFKHWPNVGYLISAVSVLVSDILWLRSLLIVANCFGILVNRSFSFWTGIYWNVFFILANLLQIGLILLDRRAVQLSEEEQRLYDLVFADVFSVQEFNKLLQVGTFRDLEPGERLMTQGSEIHTVYLIHDGLCRVEEERRIPLARDDAQSASAAVAASGPSSNGSSPSLLSYVFGAADDGRAHGFGADSDHRSSAAPPESAGSAGAGATSPSAVPLPPSSADVPAAPSPPEPVLSAVAHQVAALGEGVRELISSIGHSSHDPSQSAGKGDGSPTTPAVPVPLAPSAPDASSAPALNATVLTVAASSGSATATVSAAEPASSSAPDNAAAAAPATLSAASERERRKAERTARREKKRRSRASAMERQFGAPHVIASSTVSEDGQYEVRREVIGYMRGGRLVGEMSLLTTAAASPAASSDSAPTSPAEYLAPSFIASASPSVATATVTCVERTRALVWSRERLRSLFFRFPTLSVGWYTIVSSDLVHRLSEARHLSLFNGYKLLLLGVCAEGRITAKQRSAVDEYRRLNSISDDDHVSTLRDIGWTKAEWERGSKRLTWMESLAEQLGTRRASL